MTWIRTHVATRLGPDGISRSSRLETIVRANLSEGVTFERVASFGHIAVTSADDRGVATTAGLDLSSAELRHISKAAADLADLLDREA